MYAIVDIETTGGSAGNSGITEIAIVLHNGTGVEGRYETLINPGLFIPKYITALTGISQYMVADAPSFAEVAPQIFNLLNGRIFVAHNVNFDFSFVHAFLRDAGYNLVVKKLCTVRYARKVWPGLPSYSLGNLAHHRGISNAASHRAGGDADTTTILLQQLMAEDEGLEHLQALTKGKNANSYLPMNVPADDIETLPYCAGVYYFHDKAGKVIYVGKAANLKFRVRSHFANNSTNLRKQEFIRNIYRINYRVCATELKALVLEALEIKRLWPTYNRSQKRFEQLYGLYVIEDRQGLQRLAVEKKRKHLPSLYAFHTLDHGFSIARKLVALFDIDAQWVFAGTTAPVVDEAGKNAHNLKMKSAINHLRQHLPNFGIVQNGADQMGMAQKVGYLIEEGQFAGMGIINEDALLSQAAFKAAMTLYADNDFVRSTLFTHAERYPADVLRWQAATADGQFTLPHSIGQS